MQLVREIGSYAGFAAILGLAILSALYFSQARDLRRLREWAGRAPERAADAGRPRAVAPARPAAPAQPRPVGATGGETVEQPAVQRGDGAGQPSPAPAAGTAAAPTAAAPTSAGAPPPPPPLPRPLVGGSSPAYGMVAGAPSRRRSRWLEPRYIALVVAGILVVGGGTAFAVQQLLEDRGPAPAVGPPPAGPSPERTPGPVAPSDVTFSVLNGTTVSGLAKRVADRLEAAGYRRGNVTNATEQGKAESVVLYADGARRPALAVARRLKVSQIERIDPQSQALAGDATVVVVVGDDQAR